MYFSGNSLSGNSVQKLYLAGPNEINHSNYSIVPILCLNCFTLYFYFNSYTSSFKPQLSYISIIIPQFSQPLCPTPLVLKICTLPTQQPQDSIFLQLWPSSQSSKCRYLCISSVSTLAASRAKSLSILALAYLGSDLNDMI